MPLWTDAVAPQATAWSSSPTAAVGTVGGRWRNGCSDGGAPGRALSACFAATAGPRPLFRCRRCAPRLFRWRPGIAVLSCGYRPRAKGRLFGRTTKHTWITWNGMSRPEYASRFRTATAVWPAAFPPGSSRRRTATMFCGLCLECGPPCRIVKGDRNAPDPPERRPGAGSGAAAGQGRILPAPAPAVTLPFTALAGSRL